MAIAKQRSLWAGICLAAWLAVAGAPAFGNRSYEAEIMDDQLWLGRSDAELAGSMAQVRRLGANRIRVSAYWGDIAPGRNKRRRPKRFEPTNPESRYRWANLDRVVGQARAAGLRVLVSITGPGPLWASENPSRGRLYKPRPSHYADFAQALARRYAAQVDRYAIWNEPNQGAWLQPQSSCRRTRSGPRACVAVAPHHYRRLVRAAYPRVKAQDPSATVLIGELAPTGRNDRGATRPIRPIEFLKTMACRTSGYKRIRGGACRDFKPATGDAIGHHPYSVFNGPAAPSPARDDAAFGDGSRLLAVLDRLRRVRGIAGANRRPFAVYYTEYGYQTNPPDPFSGVALRTQSRWLQEAAYRVWRHPRIRSIGQFRLTDGPLLDIPGPKRYLEFQSGLRFADGRNKPSYTSYPDPFRVSRGRVSRGGTVSFWGQVRPGTRHTVELQKRTGRSWRRLARLKTDRFGVFTHRHRPRTTAIYRFGYSYAGRPGRSDALPVRVR